jgi:hypothetical protein
VSLDQYANGLVPAVALCRRVFPERARRLAVSAADYLVTHDFQLVDPDGRRTRFGDLSWRSGLGFNSIAQLASYGVVALAASLDPEPRFAQWQVKLRDHYRVVARARITNLRILGVTNHSNDLMAFDLYRALIPLARESQDPALADLRAGLFRSHARVEPDQNAYFELVFCALEPDACDPRQLARARDSLARVSTEKRKLAPSAELLARPRRWLPGRKWKRLSSELVPMELRPASSLEWKSSPYRMSDGALPQIEYSGVDYLMAYWLYREVCAARGDCPAD